MVLGCFSGVINEYMAAKPKLTTVKTRRITYSVKPVACLEPSKITISFVNWFVILMLPDTKHAAGAINVGMCVLLVGP